MRFDRNLVAAVLLTGFIVAVTIPVNERAHSAAMAPRQVQKAMRVEGDTSQRVVWVCEEFSRDSVDAGEFDARADYEAYVAKNGAVVVSLVCSEQSGRVR